MSAQATEAGAVVVTLQNDINAINQQLAVLGSGASGLYTVIDAPSVPSRPVSRTNTLALTGGIGLAVGLIVAIGYFLILARLDESLYSRADMPEGISYPVLIQIPLIGRRRLIGDSRPKGSFPLGSSCQGGVCR